MSTCFVDTDSIVRKIWGKSDTIMFIFAGAAAEFALNKSVDWLYYTGRLPADPLGRLFSTVNYSRHIIFSEKEQALQYIDQITAIHKSVEAGRGFSIPDEAYLDVLYMLIDYSIRSYELLERKLSDSEKAEVFEVFYRVGLRMQLKGLPENYLNYEKQRNRQMEHNLQVSYFTRDLYKQYRKSLGPIRYLVLKQAQVLMAPQPVNNLLSIGTVKWLMPVVYLYKFFRLFNLESALKNAILPQAYTAQIRALDNAR